MGGDITQSFTGKVKNGFSNFTSNRDGDGGVDFLWWSGVFATVLPRIYYTRGIGVGLAAIEIVPLRIAL
jgi:hypothetical protein